MAIKVDEKVLKVVKAIRQVESGGNYSARGASNEFGAFQFMPNTWKQWAGEFLGDPNAEMSRANQNQVAYKKVERLKNRGFSPQQVIAAWNAGETKALSGDWKTNVGTNRQGVKFDTPGYVNKVLSVIGQTAVIPEAKAAELETEVTQETGLFKEFKPIVLKEKTEEDKDFFEKLVESGDKLGTWMGMKPFGDYIASKIFKITDPIWKDIAKKVQEGTADEVESEFYNSYIEESVFDKEVAGSLAMTALWMLPAGRLLAPLKGTKLVSPLTRATAAVSKQVPVISKVASKTIPLTDITMSQLGSYYAKGVTFGTAFSLASGNSWEDSVKDGLQTGVFYGGANLVGGIISKQAVKVITKPELAKLKATKPGKLESFTKATGKFTNVVRSIIRPLGVQMPSLTVGGLAYYLDPTESKAVGKTIAAMSILRSLPGKKMLTRGITLTQKVTNAVHPSVRAEVRQALLPFVIANIVTEVSGEESDIPEAMIKDFEQIEL